MQKTMQALRAVQMELNAPKNQYNSFGKYNYRSLEDILEAVKPLLAKHKLTLIITDEVKEVGGSFMTVNSEKGKFSEWRKDVYQYVEATAKLAGEDGQIEVKASAGIDFHKKGMDMSQAVGAASSYARKYALNGLFLIDDVKDADSTNTHGKGKANPEAKKKIEAGKPSFKMAAQYIEKNPDKGIAFLKEKYDIDAKTLKALEELVS